MNSEIPLHLTVLLSHSMQLSFDPLDNSITVALPTAPPIGGAWSDSASRESHHLFSPFRRGGIFIVHA